MISLSPMQEAIDALKVYNESKLGIEVLTVLYPYDT